MNDLSDLRGPLMLVIDDYHVILNPEIHEQVDYLVCRLPLGMHVVLVTNAEPPLRLGRMRAMGEMVDIGPEQLRFTDEEAAALLNGVHGLQLSAELLAALQESIEGWVAGLNLAALSLKRSDEPGRLIAGLPVDDQLLASYLWDEVVMGQPRELREFLTRYGDPGAVQRLAGQRADGAL